MSHAAYNIQSPAMGNRFAAKKMSWEILELKTSTPTREQIEMAYRRLAMKNHPDRGGDTKEMEKINVARDRCISALKMRERTGP